MGIKGYSTNLKAQDKRKEHSVAVSFKKRVVTVFKLELYSV